MGWATWKADIENRLATIERWGGFDTEIDINGAYPKFMELMREANMEHGTVNGVRDCEGRLSPGNCRRCSARKKLAAMGIV